MHSAKIGDTVKIHYNGTLDDGQVFCSTYNYSPLEFTLGKGDIIFENQIIGMKKEEKKKISLPPDEAFGYYKEEYKIKMSRDEIPEDIDVDLQLNDVIRLNVRGSDIYAKVLDMNAENILLDANHPLAGKQIHFEIQLLEVNPVI